MMNKLVILLTLFVLNLYCAQTTLISRYGFGDDIIIMHPKETRDVVLLHECEDIIVLTKIEEEEGFYNLYLEMTLDGQCTRKFLSSYDKYEDVIIDLDNHAIILEDKIIAYDLSGNASLVNIEKKEFQNNQQQAAVIEQPQGKSNSQCCTIL